MEYPGKNAKAMKKQLYKDAFLWGFVLWLIGYLFGIVLFFVVPQNMIGWVILPAGTAITLWVLYKKIKGDSFLYYLYLSIVWVIIAILFDYLFIVKSLNADGYYNPDVYTYYFLTLILPLAAYWHKKH
jgi:hypothetical protein